MKSLKIGVAGYMGAGKSTICRILVAKGFVLIDADQEAKALTQSNQMIQQRIVDCFGLDVTDGGKLSFDRLGAIVFSSIEQLKKLNAIVHPPLLELLHSRLQQDRSQSLILDAALIPLWGIESWFDVRIWVDSSTDIRLSRLIKRCSGLDKKRITERMQMQQKLFAPPASENWLVVKNDGDNQKLEKTVDILLEKFRKSIYTIET